MSQKNHGNALKEKKGRPKKKKKDSLGEWDIGREEVSSEKRSSPQKKIKGAIREGGSPFKLGNQCIKERPPLRTRWSVL